MKHPPEPPLSTGGDDRGQPSRQSPRDDDFAYPGTELDVFAEANNWKRYFARHLRPYLRGRVLEIGAGIGSTTRVLHAGSARSWTCLEPDRRLAARLRQTISALAPELQATTQVIVGCVTDLAVSTAFDTILYIDVLEHIEDDRGELELAARRLAPAGHLLVLSPAAPWLFSPFDAAIGHCRRYDRHRLLSVCPAHLQLVVVRYLDSAGLLASLANRFLLRQRAPSARQIAFWDSWLVPISRFTDPLLGYRLGKTVVGVWQSPAAAAKDKK